MRWCALVLVALSPLAARGAILEPGFTQTTYVSSPALASATGMAWAPDGSNRLFVIVKGGEVRIVKNGALLPAPFATVAPIYTNSECGLIGIAFDPNFLVNQYVYLFVTVSASEQQIIRYTAMGDVGVGKTTVVAGLPTQGNNHDGGGIGFGPDGKLYWSIGDQGSGTGVNADVTSLAAKVGRANADGTLPTDNPFVDGMGPNNDLIWARGFRNPFTLTFQPATGLLWLNVVGASYEQIFIVRRGDHGGWTTYENTQPAGFIIPVIKYRTNNVDTLPVNAATRAAGVATFTVGGAHNFRVGEKITVAGVADASFNGAVFVRTTPSSTTFTAAQAGPDAASTGGTAATQAIGGCVTGGAFYDSTLFPTAYRGNFFFGDFNTGNLERVVIDVASNTVASVDHWANSVSNAVDMALGPDGALYYVGTSTTAVFRAAYNVTAQGIVISPTNVWMAEGTPALVMVSLAKQPEEDVNVSIGRTGGDADIGVLFGAGLTFTSKNWNVPQPVTITAARDLDGADDVATLTATSRGLTSEAVTVHARDENRLALTVMPASLVLTEGTTGTFTVALSEQPSIDVVVTVARAAGDADVDVAAGSALIVTTSNWATPQQVTISAARDPDGTDDAAAIGVTASGLAGASVAVTVKDDGMSAPMITSTPVTNATVGEPYAYQVVATGSPAPRLLLDSGAPGMAIDPAGRITWTPAAGSFAVAVRAANGVTPDAVQRFMVVASGRDAGVDASPDAARPADATSDTAPRADAAPVEAIAPNGCNCSTGGHGGEGTALFAILLALSVAARRRGRGR